jgi:hypothetical protein
MSQIYWVKIRTSTRPIENENVYIMILELCRHPVCSMDRTVVLLENKVATGKNSSYRSKHYIFENHNINVRIKPRFHMQHYPRTNRKNPCPHIDTETFTSFCFLNKYIVRRSVYFFVYTLLTGHWETTGKLFRQRKLLCSRNHHF